MVKVKGVAIIFCPGEVQKSGLINKSKEERAQKQDFFDPSFTNNARPVRYVYRYSSAVLWDRGTCSVRSTVRTGTRYSTVRYCTRYSGTVLLPGTSTVPTVALCTVLAFLKTRLVQNYCSARLRSTLLVPVHTHVP